MNIYVYAAISGVESWNEAIETGEYYLADVVTSYSFSQCMHIAQIMGYDDEYLITTENFANLNVAVYNHHGCCFDFEAACNGMDDELRMSLHDKYAPCRAQYFFNQYAVHHYEKYGEVWEFAKKNPVV